MAVDITHAQTDLAGGAAQGQSMRVSYSKNVLSTGSNFSLAAYRFSTQDYLDFSNATIQLLDAEKNGWDSSMFGRPRSRFSVDADQNLGAWGQVSISGYAQNYWNQPGSDVQYQFSYSKQFNRVSFSVNANRSRMGLGDMENSFLLTMSMPLDFGASGNTPQITAQVGRDTQGNYSEQAGISGTAGQDRQYEAVAPISAMTAPTTARAPRLTVSTRVGEPCSVRHWGVAMAIPARWAPAAPWWPTPRV